MLTKRDQPDPFHKKATAVIINAEVPMTRLKLNLCFGNMKSVNTTKAISNNRTLMPG
jgi:hypothetical protein